MTDAEALEIAVARTGHQRFRELLDPAHPAYDPRYWPVVRGLAGGTPVPEPPGVFRKAANFAGAVARHVAAGLPVLSAAEADARLAVCAACDQFTEKRTCRACGCVMMDWKASMATEHCPLGKWPGEAKG